MVTHNQATPKRSPQVMGPGNNTSSQDVQFAKREGEEKKLSKKEQEEEETEEETLMRFALEDEGQLVSEEEKQRYEQEFANSPWSFVMKKKSVKKGDRMESACNDEKDVVERKSLDEPILLSRSTLLQLQPASEKACCVSMNHERESAEWEGTEQSETTETLQRTLKSDEAGFVVKSDEEMAMEDAEFLENEQREKEFITNLIMNSRTPRAREKLLCQILASHSATTTRNPVYPNPTL